MSLKKIFPLLLCVLVTFSCADDLDFSQVNDYSATPEYTGSITYFTILPIQFFDQSGVQQTEKTDVTAFRIFDNSYLRDNLVKVDFYVEIKNEFDRGFTIQIDFLDDNDSNLPTHIFKEINVSANNLDYKFNETIEVSSNPNIKKTTRVRVKVKVDTSTTPLNPSDTSEFEFKSSAKIYIDTDA